MDGGLIKTAGAVLELLKDTAPEDKVSVCKSVSALTDVKTVGDIIEMMKARKKNAYTSIPGIRITIMNKTYHSKDKEIFLDRGM